MKSSLQALPIELIECIVTLLELRDVSSLRLTCGTLEDKASQGSFIEYFKRKNVELTTRTLEDMVRVTNPGRRLGCFLQHCTITGIARGYHETTTRTTSMTRATRAMTLGLADKGPTEHHHLQRLLTEAFRNLKQHHGLKGGLASLCFRVTARIHGVVDGELTTTKPDKFRSWRAVWEAARQTFNVAMAALYESQLPVDEHLDVFGSLNGCSLACDTFLAVAQESAARHVSASLRRLSVSLSAPPLPPKPRISYYGFEEEEVVIDTEVPTQSSGSHLILQDIMEVFRIMPNLESFKFHWYHLGDHASTSPATSSATPWETNVSSAPMTGLKECSLHGVHMSESHLLQLLEAVHPTSLTLTNIRLMSGTYHSIFKYLADPDTPVTHTYLDDIRVGSDLVHFEIPGNSKFRYLRDDPGPSTLTRQGRHNVKGEPIRYRLAHGRALGSGQRYSWVRAKAQEFGPPERCGYDFVDLNLQKIAVALDDNEDD